MVRYTVSTLAGTDSTYSTDGIGTSASMYMPQEVIFASRNTQDLLFVSDFNHVIRQINLADRQVTTLAGVANMYGYYDSDFLSSYFNMPRGLWYHPSRDELYVADAGNNVIRRLVFSSGQVQTVVGSGDSSSGSNLDGDTGSSAKLHFPFAWSWKLFID